MNEKWLFLGVFGVALVINPYLACSSSDDDFAFSESDLKQAVLGRWQGTGDLDGETVEFSLVLEQASAKSKAQSLSAPKVQPQCGARSFVKPAGACVGSTSMPVSGTLTSMNPALNGVVDGDVSILGRLLTSADLALRLEDGTQLNGAIEEQAISDGLVMKSQRQLGSFSLARP
jgi:hypothetical protein